MKKGTIRSKTWLLAMGLVICVFSFTSVATAVEPVSWLGYPNQMLALALRQTEAFPLAERVARPRTATEAHDALLEVFSRLQIGVFAADGTAIVPAVVTRVDDVYLYEFHIDLLALAIAEKRHSNIGAFVDFLEAADYDFGETSYEDVFEIVLKTVDVAWAAAGHRIIEGTFGPNDFLPAFYWSLQLQRGRNPSGELWFLESYLLLVDALTDPPAFRDDGGVTQLETNIFKTLSEALAAPVAKASVTNLCSALRTPTNVARATGEPQRAWGRVKDYASTTWPRAARAARRAAVVTDILHKSIKQAGYDIVFTPDQQEVHYRHDPNDGASAEVSAVVVYVFDHGDLAVECGYLVGFELPAQGPVADMRVEWTLDGTLLAHGNLDGSERGASSRWRRFAESAAFVGGHLATRTDENGRTSVTYIPNVEEPLGNFHSQSGPGLLMIAVRGRQDDTVGRIGEALFITGDAKQAVIRVSWHEQRDVSPLFPLSPSPMQHWRPRQFPQ